MTFWLQNIPMENIGKHLRSYGHEKTNHRLHVYDVSNDHKRMERQNNLETVQHEQHMSSRAAKLQSRWLEVSERERQAHIFNQQLLQDFCRAQDTVNDLIARTAAMNTLRVEYERHLEELYPQWQQKLHENRLSTQRKLERHLRESVKRMDDETPEALSSNSASHSFPFNSHSNQLCRGQEGQTQRPRHTHVAERFNKPKAPVNQNNFNPSSFSQLPYTWLTQVNQPIPRSDQMATEPRGAQSSHGRPLPPFYPNLPARGEIYNSYAPVQQQEPPFAEDHLNGHPPHPLFWAGVGKELAPGAEPNPYESWPPFGLPMLNPAVLRMIGVPGQSREDIQSSRGMGEGGSGRGDGGPMDQQTSRSSRRGQRRAENDGTNDRTCELDTKPVRLSGADDESSAASSTSGKCKKKKKEMKGAQKPVIVEREDTISLRSSAVSRASVVPSLRHEALSPTANIEDSSSESAEQTQSVSRRSKSTNETSQQNKVRRENKNIKITPMKQLGKSAAASPKAQEETEEDTQKSEESLVPSVKSDTASGGDEGKQVTDDEDGEEEQINEEMVGQRLDKEEKALEEEEESEVEEDDDEEEEDNDEKEEDEEEEVLSHCGQLKASSEAALDRVISDGSQRSQNVKSKKSTSRSPERKNDKDDDKSQSEDDTSAEKEHDDDDDDDEEKEDDGSDEDNDDDDVVDDDDGDVDKGDEQKPMLQSNSQAIRKEESLANRNHGANLENEDEDEELYNEEIEDDEDDEVIVGTGYERSEGHTYDFLKYLDKKDEGDDEIEDLLAPKVEVPKQKEIIPQIIVVPKGSDSDSGEEAPPMKSSPVALDVKDVDSDDEFDDFYD